jgi:cell pole-organizing protein PopZ
VEAGGAVAAGVLPAFVAPVAPGAVDVAFSEPAAPTADFAAGVAAGAGVSDDVGADVGDGALVPAAVAAAAYAFDGAPTARLVAQPNANAARSSAWPDLGEAMAEAADSGRTTRSE